MATLRELLEELGLDPLDFDGPEQAREAIEAARAARRGLKGILRSLGLDEPNDFFVVVWEVIQEVRNRRFVDETELENRLRPIEEAIGTLQTAVEELRSAVDELGPDLESWLPSPEVEVRPRDVEPSVVELRPTPPPPRPPAEEGPRKSWWDEDYS